MLSRTTTIRTITFAGAGALLALSGCYRPSGGYLFNYTGAPHTYISTESLQKSIDIVDTRDESIVFTIDIPPGQELVIDFDEGDGDDPVQRPDLMRYQIFPAGTQSGSLRNAMTVPAAAARRVDVRVHQGPAYAVAPTERSLRTDEMADRPAWWTPEGGPMPDSAHSRSNYDH